MENPRYEKLKTLLKELFQLDQPDLDFGIYRIMHAKSAEVNKFLDEELLPQITAAFSQYSSADRAELEKELARAIEQAKSIGVDPGTTPKVQELRQKIATDAVDIVALESEVYDHLYSFFRRYYSEGDFLSKRVYKEGVYAIPYEGEEVKLYWANYDQYYIKTSEYLRDYSFMLRPDNEKNPMRVHFRLVDAVEGEHDNVKEQQGKERRFKLVEENPVTLENNELIVRFTYQTEPETQKELNQSAETAILAILKKDTQYYAWLELLSAKHRRSDGTISDNTRLRVHLDRYTARNTFDYFIHKDLGSFLRRELDFYIKNEVMHLDDIEDETAPRVEQYLSKIKVIRTVAGKIIDFLAQLENFQKKLWLKKKFVYETGYCIRLGIVPETFYPEIAGNRAQWEEWDSLLHFDADVFKEEQGTLFSTSAKPQTVEFLKAHPTLMLDTRHFTADFTARILETFDNLDEQTDGILIHSENFQALNLMQRRYREKIKCVYIDPPYNTAASEILYKNDYKHSTWLSFIENRLSLSKNIIIGGDSVYVIAIDDTEVWVLLQLIDITFHTYDQNVVVVNHHPAGAGLEGTNISSTHEYAIFLTPTGKKILYGNKKKEEYSKIGFIRTGTAESNLRTGRPNSFYAILVEPNTSKVVGAEKPPIANDYPKNKTADGFLRIYPLSADGTERVWRRSYESCLEEIQKGNIFCENNKTLYLRTNEANKYKPIFSNWTDSRYNAGVYGTNILSSILGIPLFSYPKSIYTVIDCINAVTIKETNSIILDYFAGSGTTGHAVINLNREDGGQRKFILVEMAEIRDHPFMIGCQFHPEFLSRPTSPHPLFSGFIKAVCQRRKLSVAVQLPENLSGKED